MMNLLESFSFLRNYRRVVRLLPNPIKDLIRFLISPRYYFRIILNDIKAFLGSAPGESKVIFVAGYPKSGTTWMENFISHLPGYSPRILTGSREVLRQHGLPQESFANISRNAYSSVKTHIKPSEENISVLLHNKIMKVLVMYRDPRDIIVSHYYHVLKDNPWPLTDPHYVNYNEISKEEGLNHSIDMIVDDYSSWVKGWKNVGSSDSGIHCLFLTYEELRDDPRLHFKHVLSFFGVELNDVDLDSLVEIVSMGRARIGFLPGKKSTKRKGLVGEWGQELSSEQKQRIKDKIGQLLVDLGYEDSFDW